MSGNGKQVQLAPNQRYCIPPRPLTPQRADGFPMPSGGVGGGYVTPNATGNHHTMRGHPQAPTPPQQDLKQAMYSQQNAVRTQQYSQTYRAAPPQTQSGVGVVHHQQRAAAHHRQPTPGPASAPSSSAWPAQQMVYPVYIPHMPIPTPNYPQQQPARPQFLPQAMQHAMPTMMQQHSPYFCPTSSQPYLYGTGGAPGRGGPSPAQMPPPQNVTQTQQAHQFVTNRYSSPIPHTTVSSEKKSRSHAIPIIDPKSGKEVVQDDVSGNNDSAESQPSHQDENILAAVEEFSRRITDAANNKNNPDILNKDVENNLTNFVDEGNYKPEENNLELSNNDVLTDDNNKSELDYNDDKNKYIQLNEINQTPVVSAISNSPEIVPKQCHLTKQKQIESNENRKNQQLKPIKAQVKPLSDSVNFDQFNSSKVETKDTAKEFGAQHILTSALQTSKLVEEDVKVTSSNLNDENTISVAHVEIPPCEPTCDSVVSSTNETVNSVAMSDDPVETSISISQTELNPKIEKQQEHIVVEEPAVESNIPITAPSHVETDPSHDETVEMASDIVNSEETCDKDATPMECPEVDAVEKNNEVVEVFEVDIVTAGIKEEILNNENDHFTINQETAEITDKMPAENIDEKSALENDMPLKENSVEKIPFEIPRNDSDNQESVEQLEDKPKGPVLKYVYKENQWSPLNTCGKKCYDTDFLMSLRNNPNSKKKPEHLTQLDIYSDNISRQPRNNDVARSVSLAKNENLLPLFAKGGMNATPNRKSQHGKPLKDSKGIPVGAGPGVLSRSNLIHVNLSLRSDVKLNESENAWKPSRLHQENSSEEELQTKELCRTFTSTLNKLTPQNFDTLISQVRKLNINTDDRLSKVIDLVFEKAIDEPNFSLTYALMCKELSDITLPASEKAHPTFCTLIVNKCRHEFENNDDTAKRLQKEIDECMDPEKRKEMLLNLEEVESKIRRRSVGNVRFIGEIFKQKLIRPDAIIRCIQHLLRKVEEETLECLCKLLTTIGKDLEKKYNEDLQPYFLKMKAIVENKSNKLTSRVRFMLQDVIDLRINNWVPRQQVVNPKTMDQIKLEVELEQNKPIFAPSSSYNTLRKDDRPNNMNKRGGSKSTSDEVWLSVPGRNSRNSKQAYTIDPAKLRMVVKPVTQTSLQPSTPNAWGKGSTVNKKPDTTVPSSSHKPTQLLSAARKPMETSNAYLPLENQFSEELATSSLESVSRKPSYKSKGASIERSTFKSKESEQSGNVLSESSNQIKEILAYAHSDTVYGMLGRIEDTIKCPDYIPGLCKELVLWGMSKEVENMLVIGEVTGTLVDDKYISSEHFLTIFKETIDESSSLFQKDASTLAKKFGAFIWAHVKKNPLNLDQIHNVFIKAIDLGYGFDLLSAIFIARLKKSPNDVQSLWEKSSLTLSDWMDNDGVSQFSEEFPLKWIYQKSANPSITITPEEACAQMLKQMQDGKSRDDVKEWIEKHVGNGVREAWFIRALTEAIHTFGLCCHEAPKKLTLNSSRLEQFYPLLNAYINGQEKHELECLFAIQRLIHKHEHPQGITNQLFEYLWDCGELVSLEGIISWEKNDDPKEFEGKGVMLKTLTSFLTSIKSEDQSSDDANSIICEEGY